MFRISLQTLRAHRANLAGAFVAIWLAVTLAYATGLLMAGALSAPGPGRFASSDLVVRADPSVKTGDGDRRPRPAVVVLGGRARRGRAGRRPGDRRRHLPGGRLGHARHAGPRGRPLRPRRLRRRPARRPRAARSTRGRGRGPGRARFAPARRDRGGRVDLPRHRPRPWRIRAVLRRHDRPPPRRRAERGQRDRREGRAGRRARDAAHPPRNRTRGDHRGPRPRARLAGRSRRRSRRRPRRARRHLRDDGRHLRRGRAVRGRRDVHAGDRPAAARARRDARARGRSASGAAADRGRGADRLARRRRPRHPRRPAALAGDRVGARRSWRRPRGLRGGQFLDPARRRARRRHR